MTIKPRTPAKEPQNAVQRPSRAAVGDRKTVAEGVRTAVRPVPQSDDGRRPLLNPLEGRAAS